MSEDNKNIQFETVKFSKDAPIIEISTKQSQIQTTNIMPPVKPKEIKKE